jgi:myo-inositol-1-phosphate synthase
LAVRLRPTPEALTIPDVTSPSGKTGVWLIGAHGGLATTILAGTRMIVRGLVSTTGLLTETLAFSKLDLPALGDLVFGGHDIRQSTVFQSAREINAENRTFDIEKLMEVKEDLDAIDAEICHGTAHNCGPAIQRLGGRRTESRNLTLRQIIERLQADLRQFMDRHRLTSTVVVNVASTEPPIPPRLAQLSLKSLEGILDRNDKGRVRASVLYGYAAAGLGCPFINFTPNAGCLLPAIQTLARRNRAPLMGNDGKTGETLVKSALAPMFKYRNLRVLTWQGYNILGDRDGQVLSNPAHKRAKIVTKDGVLSHILGYPLHTHVGIDYVPSLKDQKTAWDFIHFAGFLDFKMSLQFTWQGCDAILAAPVVLDMVRLAEAAHRYEEMGLMTQLACFFKSPVGVDEHDLHFQFHHLLDYVSARRSGRPWKSGLVVRAGEIKLPARRR